MNDWNYNEIRERAQNLVFSLESDALDALLAEIDKCRTVQRDKRFKELLGNFTAAANKLKDEFPLVEITIDVSDWDGYKDEIDILEFITSGDIETHW